VNRRIGTGKESVPKIIINDKLNLFLTAISILLILQTTEASECCLTKLLPYIKLEKCIYILALKMASPENRHCADRIGTHSFSIRDAGCY